MTNSEKSVEKVWTCLEKALAGVDAYLSGWEESPQDFTTKEELNLFSSKLREMQASLDKSEAVPILGFWRIMETWPYNNEIRKNIVEAEYEYERLISKKSKPFEEK